MEEEDIYEMLKILAGKLKNKRIMWRVEGSANLKIQGVQVNVNDLDITTDDKGIEKFRKALKELIIKDFNNEKIKAQSLICKIKNFEVEINSYEDKKLSMLGKARKIKWKGLVVPILPLQHAKEFYRLVGRKEKVKLIENYLGIINPPI